MNSNNKMKYKIAQMKICKRNLLCNLNFYYVKLATLCHRARNIIPQVIKLQDYSKFVKNAEHELYQKTDLQNMCEHFIYLQENFQKLMKDQFIIEINQQLKDFKKKTLISKEVLLDILVAAVNFFMKKNVKKNELVDYILQKGVQNVFKSLDLNYVKPSKVNLNIPSYPSNVKQSSFNSLIFCVRQYFDIQQNLKHQIEKQSECIKKIKQEKYQTFFEANIGSGIKVENKKQNLTIIPPIIFIIMISQTNLESN
ncbi:hypothetical protein ABPG72_017150 [Tetrahymena utriculariae]